MTHLKESKLTKRIHFLPLLVLAVLIQYVALTDVSVAQTPANELEANQAESNPGDVVRLESQLINGLRVVTSEQRQYVSQIVALVNQGKLPRAMVNVIYQWSLQRNPSVPFPYFQIALRALAQRRGIVVP